MTSIPRLIEPALAADPACAGSASHDPLGADHGAGLPVRWLRHALLEPPVLASSDCVVLDALLRIGRAVPVLRAIALLALAARVREALDTLGLSPRGVAVADVAMPARLGLAAARGRRWRRGALPPLLLHGGLAVARNVYGGGLCPELVQRQAASAPALAAAGGALLAGLVVLAAVPAERVAEEAVALLGGGGCEEQEERREEDRTVLRHGAGGCA
eukprot:CAMPEP_0115227130 /NCGR_PEP_ID=MMETSP0270-20121206/30985_1 /TAXON_ID=71861 /ORGANISM="Scrippsiella trochoidea, Strain CCMP3099" /LENGTH=215 /DNA_ID=CAMNT_0002641569 /DNA_START=129 /DNA_END=774 /DNA_ORIENTATION=+